MDHRVIMDNEKPIFSYQPMPFYTDCSHNALGKNNLVKYKLDLNLYCIKRPKQTCFVQVTNPNMLAWGIEQGDILVVEQANKLTVGDLIVLEQGEQFLLYELLQEGEQEWLFMSLDAKYHSISTKNWQELKVLGRVTNTIHQFKPRKNMFQPSVQ
ncbi:LexA family protein [Volucribacter amazonae]|nr:S24 family peptidase [Volucribacter amazonae]